MKNYYSISEFASLRNININSLRYYEKMGLLRPAVVDERTGYRYYSPEQLSDLDMIVSCIAFDVPLKTLKEMKDSDDYLDMPRLLMTGRDAYEKKIKEMQTGIKMIDHNLKQLKESEKYKDTQGIYTRSIPERKLIVRPYDGSLTSFYEMQKEASALYVYAQKRKYYPLMPSGILLKYTKEISSFLFFEVMGDDITDDALVKLPDADYTCLGCEIGQIGDMKKFIDDRFGASENRYILICNFMVDKYRFDTQRSEIQQLLL